MDGPQDPMLVTSSTPGASAAPGTPATASGGSSPGTPPTPGAPPSSSPPSSGSCKDLPTPDGHSCADQKLWGKCEESFIRENAYCRNTCGHCGGSSGASGAPSPPKVQAQSGPSQSGRKLLLRAARRL